MNKDSFNKVLNKTVAQIIQRQKKEPCCQHPNDAQTDALRCLCQKRAIPYFKKDGTLGNACDELGKTCISSYWDCDAPCCYSRKALRDVIERSQGRWKNFCKVVVV